MLWIKFELRGKLKTSSSFLSKPINFEPTLHSIIITTIINSSIIIFFTIIIMTIITSIIFSPSLSLRKLVETSSKLAESVHGPGLNKQKEV